MLARSAGAEPITTITGKRNAPDAALFVGSGKAPQSGFATSNWGARAVIDATKPQDFAFGERSQVPKDVMERINLDDYLAPSRARMPVGAK